MDGALHRILKQLELFNGPAENAPERMNLIKKIRDHLLKGWQPIENAPKDGTSVMLYFPDYEHPIQVGYYAVIETTKNGKRVQKDEYWCGKWMEHWIIRSCFSKQDLPSHWMPLPQVEAPETELGEFQDDGDFDWGDDRGFDDMEDNEETEVMLAPGVKCLITKNSS